MSACHHARINVLNRLSGVIGNKSDPGKLASLTESAEKCVSVLAQNSDVSGSRRLIHKLMSYGIDPHPLLPAIIVGVASSVSPSGVVSNSVLNQVESVIDEIGIDNLSSDTLSHIASIYAIHGIRSEDISKPVVQLIRAKCTDKITLIGVFRKLKREKKLVWDLYTGICRDRALDPVRLTEYMASACAVNGWSHRVSGIVTRRDIITPMTPNCAALFIKAFTHHPLGPETVSQVWELAKLPGGKVLGNEVLEALIEYYAVNNQWTSVARLRTQLTTPPSPRLVSRIFRKVDQPHFFPMLRAFRTDVDSSVTDRAIDYAAKGDSSKALIQVLELVYTRGSSIGPVQLARIAGLIDEGAVSVRVRNRIQAVLAMIEKQNSDKSFIS